MNAERTTGDGAARPQVSAVIPIGQAAPELKEVLTRFAAEFARRGATAEFVVVLDGVSDAVFDEVKASCPAGSNVRLVRLNHPFGESTALAAGFGISRGEVIVTLPSYLQVEPEDVHNLLDAIEDGSDLVAGLRVPRVDSITNRLQSALFNGLMRSLTGVRLHDLNCPVRAIRRKVLEDVATQGDMVRFLPVMALRHGFRVGEAKVRHLRERGKTGFFGIGVYIRRFLDVINLLFLSKFTRAPLRFFGVVGILFILVGLAICGFLTVDYFFRTGTELRDKVSLVLGVMLFVLGVQIFSIGLVGEIIIFTQAKNLKDYRLEDQEEWERRARQKNGRRSPSSGDLRIERAPDNGVPPAPAEPARRKDVARRAEKGDASKGGGG